MRKVIGIGETVFDIIFNEFNQPISGRPGGSAYNALISLGRRSVPATFISEVGNDRVGKIITDFLEENGVDASNICVFPNRKSPLALAFLDKNRNAQYQFYKDYDASCLDFTMPTIEANDIVLLGSYFAIMPSLRHHVKRLLDEATLRKAIIYYDVNFRKTHAHEVQALLPAMIENFRYSDIVKGSDEDFEIIFGTSDIESVYNQQIKPYCSTFICTLGANGADVYTPNGKQHFDGKQITPISTVGAGDSFNAGFIYGLISKDILKCDISHSETASLFAESMQSGISFSAEVCLSLDNYVSK